MFSGTVLLALAALASAVDPLVPLNYTSYQGTALNNGISQWLGMRFAAPPIGDLRFAAPQDPPSNTTVQQAVQHGPICLSVGGKGNSNTTNEDCLFLDLYAPSNATKDSKLPVFFFIQGGGFASNSNPNLNGSGLIEASDMNIVVVNFNYRVGPYGFLAGKEVLDGGSINNGLKDQLKALGWVRSYVAQFGGDPDHITIGGDSAGAQSVTMLLTAYGGNYSSGTPFHAAAAESPSFPTMFTVPGSQFAYDGLVNRTGCSSSSPDTLACLRNLSVDALQAQNFPTPFPGAQGSPLYLYGPTIDGDLVEDYTYKLLAQGKFVDVPTINGDDYDGGSIFAPRNITTLNDSNVFLHNQFPALRQQQIAELDKLYTRTNVPDLNANATAHHKGGLYYPQAAKVYGDMRYMCPGLYVSTAYSNHSQPAWNYLWNVTDPTEIADGEGVPHTVEVNAIWGPTNLPAGSKAPASYYANGTNANIVPLVQGYWTSFIRSYDPNTHRLPGSPEWCQWTAGGQERQVFVTNATRTEPVDALQQKRCAYLESIALSVDQ